MCAGKERTLNHIHLLFHSFSDVKRETETVGHWTETNQDGQTMDALSCRGQRKGSNCSFLDLARHFVCFHFLLESSEWKTSCCFS